MSAEEKKVSVIIATYNAAGTLETCLQSIFSQKYYPIEIIVIDGASTDGTTNILEKYNQKITWISEPDGGIYYAMNKGLQYVTGNWIYFAGADDQLLPGFSDMIADLQSPNTVYYGNVIHKGIKRAGKLSPYYMAKVGIYHQAVIYPVAAFTNLKYDTQYSVFSDYALNFKLFGRRTFTFEYRDHVIANYAHTGVSSYKRDAPFEKDKNKLILKNFGIKIWLRYQFRLLKSKLKAKSH
jgi:glycosyltransferase involved in cell wall biosynthesis